MTALFLCCLAAGLGGCSSAASAPSGSDVFVGGGSGGSSGGGGGGAGGGGAGEPADPKAAINTTVSFVGPDQLVLRARLIKPTGVGPFPAVVVLHDCDGPWSATTPGALAAHYLEWSTLLSGAGYVALFVDSFTPRGGYDYCSLTPPADKVCSPAYERPRDAYRALDYLRTLQYVTPQRIGVLGFSHGGSTALAAVADVPYLKSRISTWQVTNNGSSYAVPDPPAAPDAGGFACAVAFYPGCGFYGYYGSPTVSTSGAYRPTAPTLLLAAGLDPLYTDGATQGLVDKAVADGASHITHNPIELQVFRQASHGFDGSASGDDGTASLAARPTALNWLATYLKAP